MGFFSAGASRWLVCSLLASIAYAAPGNISITGRDGLTVAVAPNGAYTITAPVSGWAFAGSVGQTLIGMDIQRGTDTVGGDYSEIVFDFYSDAWRHAAIRAYTTAPAVVFTATATWGGPNSFSFPSLTQYPITLHRIAFSGTFAFPTFFGTSEDSPWVGFDASFHTAILSPLVHFMVVSSAVSRKGELQSGISSKIAALPVGFTHQT